MKEKTSKKCFPNLFCIHLAYMFPKKFIAQTSSIKKDCFLAETVQSYYLP